MPQIAILTRKLGDNDTVITAAAIVNPSNSDDIKYLQQKKDEIIKNFPEFAKAQWHTVSVELMTTNNV